MLATNEKVFDVITLLDMGEIAPDTLKMLQFAVDNTREIDFGEDYDLREELVVQMRLVQAVRTSILDSRGRIRDDTTVTEVKSVLDASRSLADMLNKVNKDLVNQERIQAVEASFMTTIEGMPKQQQIIYIEELERRMKIQEVLAKK